jgi:hypothetical protein
MSTDAAKAMFPGLAYEPDAPSPQSVSREKAGFSASEAMYGKPKPEPEVSGKVRVPITAENLSRVPHLVRKR